jgi:hypothetical protein
LREALEAGLVRERAGEVVDPCLKCGKLRLRVRRGGRNRLRKQRLRTQPREKNQHSA